MLTKYPREKFLEKILRQVMKRTILFGENRNKSIESADDMQTELESIHTLVKDALKQNFELMPNTEPKFEDILKDKRKYYGCTEAAIQFAAEEYARQLLSAGKKKIK